MVLNSVFIIYLYRVWHQITQVRSDVPKIAFAIFMDMRMLVQILFNKSCTSTLM